MFHLVTTIGYGGLETISSASTTDIGNANITFTARMVTLSLRKKIYFFRGIYNIRGYLALNRPGAPKYYTRPFW